MHAENGQTKSISPREVWFEHDGARLFSLEQGRGASVVFLHGGLADHRASLARVGALAATHRLLCPDLRGSGRSVDASPLHWDRLADDVAALLAHLHVDRAIVGGTSMGSAVALRFALRHPRMLRGLLLYSPVYPGADRPLDAAAERAMRAMGAVGERVLVEGVAALRALYEPLPEPVRALALEMMRGFDAPSIASTMRFLSSCAQPIDSVRALEAISVPALLQPGTDAEHPAEVAALYARHLRHAHVVAPGAVDGPAQLARFCASLEGDDARV